MPVEHFGRVLTFEICSSNRFLVKNESSLLIGDVAGSGRVGGCRGTTLTVLEFVQVASDGLKTAAYTSLSRDQRNRFALEVPLGVLETHAIDFFVSG